jgi:hypothetical protein
LWLSIAVCDPLGRTITSTGREAVKAGQCSVNAP